jgi:hypothetical protein
LLKFIHKSALLLVVTAGALSACGGGGGGGGAGFAGLAATSDPGTSTTPESTPIPNDVVDSAGNPAADAYKATAAQFAKDAGIAYRYGNAPAVNNSGIPTLASRPDQTMSYHEGTWQVGGPVLGEAGNYSTNQAHVSFVADNPATRVGVGDLQISAFAHNTFAQAPQLPWQEAAAWDGSGGRDNYNIATYKSAGLVTGEPVAIARCGGRTGLCSESLVAFQNGLIGTAGSNTANNRSSVKLPANKVPTGIAMTNNSEYALVTVWDTTALKGQVAVISLAGLCNNCDPYNPNGGNATGIRDTTYSAWYDWWHEWNAVYPGLPNMGNIAFMKVLGYIDLPGMNAPTEIAVTTGFDQFNTTLPEQNGEFMGRTYSPLTDAAKRATFSGSGSNANRYAKSGVAVVISKSEKKAAFIDLKPLFSYVNNVYFGTGPTEFTNLGQADNQWPYTFANKPQQTPTVISTVTLDDRPTAVRTTLFGSAHRAWIATEAGSLRIYGLGRGREEPCRDRQEPDLAGDLEDRSGRHQLRTAESPGARNLARRSQDPVGEVRRGRQQRQRGAHFAGLAHRRPDRSGGCRQFLERRPGADDRGLQRQKGLQLSLRSGVLLRSRRFLDLSTAGRLPSPGDRRRQD